MFSVPRPVASVLAGAGGAVDVIPIPVVWLTLAGQSAGTRPGGGGRPGGALT